MKLLAVSPHLDDAAFSVGASLAVLVAEGHDVTVLTCFTGSVDAPTGFALACQTDKGLAPDVDYMAVRRAEDLAAQAVLGTRAVHLDLLEAPHRGYDSAPELFAGIHAGDRVDEELASRLEGLEADVLLAPQGLGSHVDHLQVVRAVARLARPTAWWRDAPYVLKAPDAAPSPDLPTDLRQLELGDDRMLRADACACYATQLGFQFGGEDGMRAALADMAEPLLADGRAVELLSTASGPG